jgi:glycosyltransferase involved in cell wall biosynthesis
VAYLVSHPIQYQAPLLRRIAQEPDIDLTVWFGSDFSVRGYTDRGFGVGVEWDVPLLDGYRHEFLPSLRDEGRTGPATMINHGIFSRLRGRAGEPGYDVLWLHGYSTVNAMHAMLAAKALGIPVIVRAESWLGDRERGGARLAAKRMFFAGMKGLVDAVLPIGSRNAEYWRHYLGEDMPAFLMPYAVDNSYFQERSAAAEGRREELRRELGLEAGRQVILYASKLTRRKRCADLLDAYSRLSPGGGREPEAQLVIVGDGEERASLQKKAASTGWDIKFCGFRNQSELPRFFDLATVFVLPSEHEPWGLIVNEVMNAARPVIVSSDVGCQADLITSGREGYVFPVGDVDALATCLRCVLESPAIGAEMGANALERIRGWNFEGDVRGLREAIEAVTGKLQT